MKDPDDHKPLLGDGYQSINNDSYGDPQDLDKTTSINGNYIPNLESTRNDFQVRLQRARSRYVTVEVPLLLVSLAISILSTLRSEYLRERVARDIYHYNLSSNASGSCGQNVSDVENDIQATTSNWLLYLGAIQSIPGLFMAIFLGSVSDRIGRKPALALCTLGYAVNTLLNIVVIYFHLPIPAFILGDLIGGLCGGLALLLSSGASYVSDVTTEKMRTFRIVIVESVLFLGFGIGQIALGFALQYSNDPTLNKYVLPLWIAFGCTAASLLYVMLPWLLIETVDTKKANDQKRSQITATLVGIYYLLKENSDKRRMKVIGFTIIMMFAVFVVQSASQVFVVYSMGEPFCLGPLDVSFISVTSVLSGSIGMIVGGAILPRFISDYWILQLSLMNSMMTCIITGLATTKLVLYLSSAVNLIKSLSFPVIRSQLSKVSLDHEKGLMLAFIGCMDGLASFLSPLVANSIYSKTLYFYPPFVFFFLCALQIIPLIVTGDMESSCTSINNSDATGIPYSVSPDGKRETTSNDERFEIQLKRATSRYITVEIPVALACLTYQILLTMKAEYIHDRVAEKYNSSVLHNRSSSTCGSNEASNTSSTIEDDIQAETSTWLLYLGLAYALPGVVMAILLGSLSDRLGRKPAFHLNITGYCLQPAIYLVIVYFQAPIEYLLVGDFISGFTGGAGLLLSTGAAYISDVTSEKTRTPRIIIFETIFFVGLGVGQISLGIALQYSEDHTFHKYLVPLWIALGCALAALVYTALPNVLIETVDRRTGSKSVGVKVLASGLLDLLRINTNGRRIKVIMYTVIMISIIITAKCQSQLTVLYSLGEPFCLNPLMVSVLNIVGLSSQSLGMIFSGAILGRMMSENWILQLSLWNMGIFCLIVALAQKSYQLFIASGIGVMNAICFPVIRSQLSKLATVNERGLMLAFVGCMEGIGTLLTPVIANNIYSATVSFYPPLVFFFLMAFQILPIVCVSFLQCKERTQGREIKYHVIVKEDQ